MISLLYTYLQKAGLKHLLSSFKCVVLLIVIFSFKSYAKLNTDSIRKAIDQTDNDTVKAKSWNVLSIEYSYAGYYELAERAAYEALDLSKRNNFSSGIADSYYYLGISFSKRAQFDKAIEWFLKAMSAYDAIGNARGKGFAVMLIGVIHYDLKNYTKAEEEYNKALDIFTKADIKSGIANCLVNLGFLYTDKKEYDKAIEFSERAYVLFKEGRSSHGMAECLANIANVYAVQYQLNDSLGNNDISTEFLSRAVKAYRENIKTYGDLSMPVEQSQQYVNLFNLYLKKAPGVAEKYLDSASRIITGVNSLYNQYIVSHAYYRLALSKNDSSRALHYFLEYTSLKDSVFNVEKAEKLQSLNVEIKEIEKQKEIDLLKKEKEKEQLVLWGIVVLSVFLIVFLFLLYRRYQENRRSHVLLEEKNKMIQTKNKEILDSIAYARRIQATLITSEKYIHKNLEKLTKFRN
jgi:tetratricopeptide (TPR) repeat protein